MRRPRPESWEVAELGFKPSQSDDRIYTPNQHMYASLEDRNRDTCYMRDTSSVL